MADELTTLRNRGVEAHRAGKLAEAGRLYAAYLSHVPGDAAIWSNLGVLRRTTGQHRMALRAQERAFALTPRDSGTRNNYANILSDIGRYDQSIEVRRDLLKEAPDDLQNLAMVGRCLRGKGAYQAAIDHLSAARERFPDDAELEVQLAFAQLGQGAYRAGLNSYRARWRAGELEPRNLPIPEWQGEDLTGKTIVVLPEQGFGDAVLFSRFLPVLKDRGAHVKAVIKPPLQRLLSPLAGADEVVPGLTRDVFADYWVNMMDLASLHFETDATIPPPTRLSIPQAATDRAKAMTAAYQDRFRVGVVWTGSMTYKGNAFRSFTHREFLPCADIPGVQLFSLYKGPALDAYYADGADAIILDAGSTEQDFADTAATMRALDLVITSDTATAHIAGSLGVPVWTVLHWDPFWVWTHAGDTTDWYPGMRLFRQTAPLDWGPVMQEVAEALRLKKEGAS